MLTEDNTEGFTKEQLEKMNAEVNALLDEYCEHNDPGENQYELTQWAEEKVLKKYGGA